MQNCWCGCQQQKQCDLPQNINTPINNKNNLVDTISCWCGCMSKSSCDIPQDFWTQHSPIPSINNQYKQKQCWCGCGMWPICNVPNNFWTPSPPSKRMRLGKIDCWCGCSSKSHCPLPSQFWSPNATQVSKNLRNECWCGCSSKSHCPVPSQFWSTKISVDSKNCSAKSEKKMTHLDELAKNIFFLKEMDQDIEECVVANNNHTVNILGMESEIQEYKNSEVMERNCYIPDMYKTQKPSQTFWTQTSEIKEKNMKELFKLEKEMIQSHIEGFWQNQFHSFFLDELDQEIRTYVAIDIVDNLS